MSLSTVTALSPLDGRYAGKLAQLRVGRNDRQLIEPGSRAVKRRTGRFEQGLSVGTGNGGKFSHGILLQLGLQTGEQLGVNASVDLASKNGLSTFDRQSGHLLAQDLAGLDRLLFGLGTGGVFQCSRSNGVYLAQEMHNRFHIYDAQSGARGSS